MNKISILDTYPWLHSDEPQHIVMGDDLDAALSVLLYLRHHPNAVLSGIYKGYHTLYLDPAVDPDQVVYIDLDICRPGARSLGHHIVRARADDQLDGFRSSCNPNEWAGRSLTDGFTRKFPLGTVHFLLWLYGEPLPPLSLATALIWLADSSFINGQSHRFRENVGRWLQEEMPDSALQATFDAIDTADFEVQVQAVQQYLVQAGLSQGRGQVVSRHLKLSGFQGQPTAGPMTVPEIREYIGQILDAVSLLTGWEAGAHQKPQGAWVMREGKRATASATPFLTAGELDRFLVQNHVFSYVFPYKHQINYTQFDL